VETREHSKTKGHKHTKSISNTEISLQIIKQKDKKEKVLMMVSTCLQPCCVPIVVSGGKCRHGGGLAPIWQKIIEYQFGLEHVSSSHDSFSVQTPLMRT